VSSNFAALILLTIFVKNNQCESGVAVEQWQLDENAKEREASNVIRMSHLKTAMHSLVLIIRPRKSLMANVTLL
jgi:hypothetical protein